MSARSLAIITTRLPPDVCGIGTYSWLLQQHWPDSARDVRFFVVGGADASRKDLDFESIVEFGSDGATLARELDNIGSSDVLLHYAGRAYHRYGCPSWLPRVLAGWKQKFPGARLAVLFHELPANFPIHSAHYWIGLCNRRVIGQLAKTADVLVTNTAEHARKLQNISGRSHIEWLPVPSNIPAEVNSGTLRVRGEFVVFGLPFGRWQTLQMFDSNIRSWIDSGRLTKLHIVGPSDEQFDARADELIGRWTRAGLVDRHGKLSPGKVSEVLDRAQFGLANASMENWSKSAVFMAFASHGCAIVTGARSDTVPFRFTIAPEEVATIDDVDLVKRTRGLKDWYEIHANWNVMAKRIFSLLSGKTREEALS